MRVHRSVCGSAVLAVAAIAGSASATTITFMLGDSPAGNTNPYFYHYASGFSVTSGGYTLTFSNPGGAPHQNSVTTPGGTMTWSILPDNELAFERDSFGLTIGNWAVAGDVPYPGYTDSFTMTLTGPTNLLLTGYEITWNDYYSGQAFNLSQGGTDVSTGNLLGGVGSKNIAGGPLFWQQGTSIDFVASGVTARQLLQIGSLTFEVTSIPGSGLAAIGTLGLAGIARRRRR